MTEALGALGLAPWQGVLIAAFFLFGGVIKGATGFGLPMMTVSLTPLIASPDLALALNTLVVPITNVAQIAAAGNLRQTLRICWPIIAGMTVTVIAATWVITLIPVPVYGGLLGGMLVLFTLLSWRVPRFQMPARHDRVAAFGTGLLGGIFGAALTAPGPVFVMYLLSRGAGRRLLLGGVGLCMFAVGILITGSFSAIGLLDGPRALASALCAIPGLLGMWIGARAVRFISVEAFRTVVLVCLLALGIYHLTRAIL